MTSRVEKQKKNAFQINAKVWIDKYIQLARRSN